MIAKLGVGANPHIRNNVSTKIIMTDFLIGLSPILLVSLFVYKKYFLVLLGFSVIMSVIIDKIFIKLFKLPKEEYSISGIITSVLLLLTLPIKTPIWVLFFGILFALVIGKFIFGGFGQNLFNPALLGRVFLMSSFPQYIYRYEKIDGTLGATILDLLKYRTDMVTSFPNFKNMIFGINIGGSIGETSAIAVIIGFVYLTFRGRIEGKIPLLMVGMVFLGSMIVGKNPFYYIFSGGVILGAVYFLTDPVSSPYTPQGKRVYAIFVGILIISIREFTAHPEGVAYAILMGNLFTPLFNKIFMPRVFGRRKNMKAFLNLLKLFTLIACGIFVLNFIDKKYSKKIEIQRENLVIKEMKELIPLGEKFDMYENSKYYEGFLFIPVYDENSKKISYIIKGKSKGYSEKEMEFILGVDLKGKTLGHRIIYHQETIGLGSKISEKEFEKLWVDKDIDSKFVKGVDSPSGATYTFLNLFKTIKEVLKIYDEKIINVQGNKNEKAIQEKSDISSKKAIELPKEKTESIEPIDSVKKEEVVDVAGATAAEDTGDN